MQTRHPLLLAGLALPAAVFFQGSHSRPGAPGGSPNPNGGFTTGCTGYGFLAASYKQLMPWAS